MLRYQVDVFKPNIVCWKILAIWPDENSSNLYKIYSVIFINVVWVMNFIFFIFSFIYTPPLLELILNQLLYFFVFLGGLTKLRMMIFKRTKIMQLFTMLDTEEFLGDEETTRKIVKGSKEFYWKFWKAVILLYVVCAILTFLPPLLEHWIYKESLACPLCEFYFLSDRARVQYFMVAYVYQVATMLGIIFFSANLNSFICGLLMMAITQFKVLNWKIANLELKPAQQTRTFEEQEEILERRLKKCLKHYDMILEYCDILQEVLALTLFVQYSTGAITICCSVCPFINPTLSKNWLTTSSYIITMLLEMMYPAMLGTNLTYESENLVFSAYCSNWISRPISFKKSLRLLMERASKPVVLTGLQMFELSLVTFASIVKTAYSLFTLMKNVMYQ